MREDWNEYRLIRLRRLKFTNWFRYAQTSPNDNRTRGSHVDRTPTTGNWNTYPRLIETVNWNKRPKK